eukprot:2192117-Pleurochrysis_carterae.AAC.4
MKTGLNQPSEAGVCGKDPIGSAATPRFSKQNKRAKIYLVSVFANKNINSHSIFQLVQSAGQRARALVPNRSMESAKRGAWSHPVFWRRARAPLVPTMAPSTPPAQSRRDHAA